MFGRMNRLSSPSPSVSSGPEMTLCTHTHLYLIFISPPDLPQQKRKMSESQNHSTFLRALRRNTSHACLAFSAKPENKTARCRSLQIFPSARRSLQALQSPAALAIKAVMRLHYCSPSVFTVSNPPLELIRRQCLLLPTRSFPGRPRTPVRASFSARGALCIDSRWVFHRVSCCDRFY